MIPRLLQAGPAGLRATDRARDRRRGGGAPRIGRRQRAARAECERAREPAGPATPTSESTGAAAAGIQLGALDDRTRRPARGAAAPPVSPTTGRAAEGAAAARGGQGGGSERCEKSAGARERKPTRRRREPAADGIMLSGL